MSDNNTISYLGCCYFLSAVVNPFLYSLLSKRFRRGFHDLVRNTKKWFRHLPILLRITPPSGSTKESERIVGVADLPSIHTSSQQGRECLMNNMCCTGTVIKKTVYRWKTNSKMIQDDRASIYISPDVNQSRDDPKATRNKETMELADIRESEILVRNSNQEVGIFETTRDTNTTSKKRTLTLRFAPDPINDHLSKSEGDATVSPNSCKLLFKSRRSKDTKIVSEGCSQQQMVFSEGIEKGFYYHKLNASNNISTDISKTVSVAFSRNMDQICLT